MLNANELATKSGPELVALFNAIPGVAPVKRFASRADAVKRIIRTLAENPSAIPPAPVVIQPKEGDTLRVSGEVIGTVAPKATEIVEVFNKVAAKVGRPRRTEFVFNYPVRDYSRTCRENSGRGRLLAAVREGLTFSQLLERCPQWDADRLSKNIQKLHTWLGYGLSTDEDGVIRLIES